MLDFWRIPWSFSSPAIRGGRFSITASGTKIYDRIAGKQNFFASRYRSAKEAVARWPLLQSDGLKGAIAYADGQFDDARYCVALVQTFTEAGGEAINHARVVRLAAGCRRQDLRGGDRRPTHRRANHGAGPRLRQLHRTVLGPHSRDGERPASRNGCG